LIDTTTLFYYPLRHLVFGLALPPLFLGIQFSIQILPPYWWDTPTWKKVVRGIVTFIVCSGILVGFYFIPINDYITSLVFNYSIPIIITHFVGTGLLPLLFYKLKLTKSQQFEIERSSIISENLEDEDEKTT